MTFPSLTANICLLSSFTTTNCFSLFSASRILLHQLLRPIILSLKIVKKSSFSKFNCYFFLTFQFQEVEKSCQWISHREKSLEKLEKKSQKRGLLYYQKKSFSLLVFSPLVSDLPVHTLKFENPSQISQGDH